MSSPWSSTRPRQATKPEMAFSSVVLPAPLGPMMPTISDGPTVRSTSSTARTPPESTVIPVAVRTGGSGGIGGHHLAARAAADALGGADEAVGAAGHHHDEPDPHGERRP